MKTKKTEISKSILNVKLLITMFVVGIPSILGIFKTYQVYQERNQNKSQAVAAHKKAQCELAITHSENVIKSWEIFNIFDDYSDIVQNIKKECSTFLEKTKKATLKIDQKDYVGALVEYDNFLDTYGYSSLVKFIPNAIEDIFSQSSPEKVASTGVCAQVYAARKNGTISKPDTILSLFHWHCGNQSYQRVECQSAIQHLDEIISLESFDSYSTKAKSIKEECEVFTIYEEKAREFENNNQLGEALVTYDEFLMIDYVNDQGPLASSVLESTETIFMENEPDKLASSRSCNKTESFIDNEIIPYRDVYLPSFYWSCSQFYLANQEHSKEIDTHIKFLNRYSKHELNFEVQSAIVKNSIVCDRHNELQENDVIAKLDNLMPTVYLSCGKAYQEVVNYPQAIEFFGKVNHYYPGHHMNKMTTEYVNDLNQEMQLIKQEMLIATNNIQDRIIACSAGNLIVGVLISLGEFMYGKDCMTGQELTTLEYLLNLSIFGDVFKGISVAQKLQKLVNVIEVALAIKQYNDVISTQNLLDDNISFFSLLKNDETMNLLAINNDNLRKLVINKIGKSINLDQQYSESIKLLLL